ncbi:polysaccharide deacetylase family protein [Ensifer sp. HO-A22]|uniref:Chitooligosaccharide deacetylase n=1 Tax=Ensifer oleiphilus TaxID=2742698 RepID=A0A7Y6QB84_9HYPH|nr:polysaccharide deacetylase family protein [Ensifer oleiphilus]NVD42175.1 polysaccharide deacetylase family protein [Ensifer oleiphilus]
MVKGNGLHRDSGTQQSVARACVRKVCPIGRFLLLAFTPWLALVFFLVEAHAETKGYAREKTVAITFDDLPHARAGEDGTDGPSVQRIDAANTHILSALKAHKAPAIGFVVESKVRAVGPRAKAILKSWTGPRLTLGNHTFSHADTNALDLAGIKREIVDGEHTARQLLKAAGKGLRFLRLPYNHTGDTPEKQKAIAALAAKRGYTIAATTIDTSDYVFDRAYERALAENDTEAAHRIRTAYLMHTQRQIAYYADLNAQALGYEPPAIMLLHVNRLNADAMKGILSLFEESGYDFVTLEKAQADAAYRRPLSYATKHGPMWGYRWAKDRNVQVDGSHEREPPEWIVSYGE